MHQPFTPQILVLTHKQQTAFENIVRKEEIARNNVFYSIRKLYPHLSIFNPFPNGKILDLSKFKVFADDISQKLIFVLGWVENIVGNGENAGYQHFSFSHNVFKSPFYKSHKTRDCLGKG